MNIANLFLSCFVSILKPNTTLVYCFCKGIIFYNQYLKNGQFLKLSLICPMNISNLFHQVSATQPSYNHVCDAYVKNFSYLYFTSIIEDVFLSKITTCQKNLTYLFLKHVKPTKKYLSALRQKYSKFFLGTKVLS